MLALVPPADRQAPDKNIRGLVNQAFPKRRALAWLVVLHRWLGIGACLLFLLWFLSGLVMLYVGFPDLTAAEKARYQGDIEWARVSVTPDEAMRWLGLQAFPRDLRLEMSGGQPVYRVSTSTGRFSLSAIDGKPIERIDAVSARAIAALVSGTTPRSVTTLDSDQWTVAGTFEGHRPLHRVALGDAAGTELYVSSRSGEIVLDSTARERTWNWVGSVVHWIYFKELRARPGLWSQVVKWVSGACIFVALTGLWLGIDRLRIRRAGALTPFRGWMAWHHVSGIVGGIVVLTWIFSGWMSMGPAVPWNSSVDAANRAAGLAAYAGHSEPTFGARLDLLRSLPASSARDATFTWVLGRPEIVLSDGAGRKRAIDALTGEARRWSRAQIESGAKLLVPGARLSATHWLNEEDAYWYSGDSQRVLPVLRFEFDDEERTWVHVDPMSGRILGWLQSGDRVNRWLFDALHTLDFRWLLAHESIRLGLIWLLSAMGLTISLSGAVIGWRRLRATARNQ
jgi:uncharacterized iron-regulated membrane protein